MRPATPADFPAWQALWDGYNAFYGRHGATALPQATTLATWTRFFDEAEPMHALVAGQDGALLGLAHFLYHRSTIAPGPICYLEDLYTTGAARGQGVGRHLIEQVAHAARAAGSAQLYWHTHTTNRTAMHLYDQLAAQSGFLHYYRNP